jgi:polyphosphate kinase
VIAALHRAAEAGKHVSVLVELKARFDEARNIAWARDLERAGVQVIYGVKGFKAHAKLLMVMRREAQGIVRYCHFGTGNYNERTARLYGDVSFLTRDADLAADASAFFNAITGYAEPPPYLKLAQSPHGIRDRMLELVAAETERSRQGQKAVIMAKINSLVDPQIIEALYCASKAGVTVRLNVRGICCLRPGVKGLSERIEVVSIVDRNLEHARVFYFHQGGDSRLYLSSADWMPRNLDRRIELLVPVEAPEWRRRLTAMLETCFRDNCQSFRLQPDGTYVRAAPEHGRRRVRAQEVFYRQACAAAREEAQARQTAFEPLVPAGRRES